MMLRHGPKGTRPKTRSAGKRKAAGSQAIRTTPLKAAIAYYLANRNCAPASKKTLLSTLSANVPETVRMGEPGTF